ncbi:Peptidyl-prolyl cis-trans isomerase Fpr3/Fpr4-like protein [Dioscorea alata]|uniref:Peptidyl-prolyl cis-trans isomerase Fpr3/Fpr4-like protein n=1 Tax=Dioscorea alata TaxID=55571 RepID=A0ACB7VY30_DIOAL|nr:Peptidyl-prolyl cis-trans isomerase Fpr3/Fpr4-like protein [Dioscorea alata]
MATFLPSPTLIIPRPIPKPHLSCSQSPQIPPPSSPSQQQPLNPISSSSPSNPNPQRPQPPLKPRVSSPQPESTDWVASTLTRRFGLGAGLAWVAFLAVGVVSEQIKTRFEASQQASNTRTVEKEEETVLPNGIKYYELTIGGGAYPKKGDLVVIDLQGRVKDSNSAPFIDTFGEGKKPLALVMGSRPYTKGMCEGIEYVLNSMRAGGKRRVIVPPTMGFGDEGVDLGSNVQIPPASTLEYIVQVDKVSIAPS